MKRNYFISPKDDAFYLTTRAVDKVVEPVSTEFLHLMGSHIKLKTVHKRDQLRKTILWLEHKAHATHSPIHKITTFEHQYNKKPFIDTSVEKIKRRLRLK